jgi:hypothetical protein
MLHSFYTGIEKILTLIAREWDGQMPSSDSWHKDLLKQMSKATAKRSAIVSANLVEVLSEFSGLQASLSRSVHSSDALAETRSVGCEGRWNVRPNKSRYRGFRAVHQRRTRTHIIEAHCARPRSCLWASSAYWELTEPDSESNLPVSVPIENPSSTEVGELFECDARDSPTN